MQTIISIVAILSQALTAFAAEDEAAIRAMLEKRTAAWAKQDVAAMVADFAEDADYISSSGERSEGKPAIEKRYRELFASGAYKNATTKQSIDKIRFIKPDVALVDGGWSAGGLVDADGKPLPDRRGMSTLVLTKDASGVWKIASLRAAHIPSMTGK